MEKKLRPKVLEDLVMYGKVLDTDFAKDCIMYAFNEGRQSVIDNIPDLEWKRENKDKYVSHTPFFNYTTELLNGYWEIRVIGIFFITDTLFATLYEAQQFANEDYKNRIKKALGL